MLSTVREEPYLELEGLVGTPDGSSARVSAVLVQTLATLGRQVERVALKGAASAVVLSRDCDARIGSAARDRRAWLHGRLSSVETAALAFRASAALDTTLQVYHVRAKHMAHRKWELLDACFGARPDGTQTAPLAELHPKPDFGTDAGVAS